MEFATTFLHSQFFITPPVPSSDFSGQTVVVTGATSGLGYEAAKHILRLGASKIILAVRNVAKGKKVAEEISSALSLPLSNIEVWELDFASFSSVKQFGERIQTLDRLDAVLQNAGIMTTKFTLIEGYESQIAVNVMSPALLGYLVIPKLQQSAAKTGCRGRLAFVDSDLQFVASLKEKSTPGSLFAALNSEETADIENRYANSKLLLMWVVRDLAQRYPFSDQSNVLITALTCGLCHSDLLRDEENWIVRIFRRFMLGFIARSTEVGSRTLVHGVIPDLGEECHGAFLMDCKVCKDLTGNSKKPEMQEARARFLDELSTRLEEISPGILA